MNKEEMIEEIKKMTVVELADLVKAIEEDDLDTLKNITYHHLHYAPEHYASLRAFIFNS